MSNIEKIKAEIERLKKILEESTYYLDNSQQALGYSFALDDFKEFIDSLPDEKPSEDLEEAARHSEILTYPMPEDGDIEKVMKVQEARIFHEIGFIAGVEWMRKHSPLPEDTVLFQKGVEEGKRLMMEEAVGGEIGYWNQRGLSIRLDQSLEKLGYGEDTEVKIIIVKKKEE